MTPSSGPVGKGIDHGNAEIGQIDRQPPVDALAGGDDAVDLLVEHGVDMELAQTRVVLDGAQKHRDAVVDQPFGDPAITGRVNRP